MLGLPYPGGPALERLAAEGDPGAYDFPIAAGVPGPGLLVRRAQDALLYKVRDLGDEAQARRADLAAAYQRAIVEALAVRVERGLRATGLERLAIGGGVAANGPLRERMAGPGGRAARPRARAVHRQRGDDRLRGALGDAAARVRRPGRVRQR
jgi:N6-L-threonylcarbamoyladenine synthase